MRHFNPEPFADFIDAFIIGEGEGIVTAVLERIRKGRENGESREETIAGLAQIDGVYVPVLYTPQYDDKEQFIGYDIADGAPKIIRRHFEPLTSGGETVNCYKFHRVWRHVYHRGGPWMWSSLSFLYGGILFPRTSRTTFGNIKRRRR